ncbi:MAG: hypothetical protein KGH94_00420 [Candidatus Micrarchaeota archaeon]|nr:hypothetical protein [Candidatus Micrarchaeota archaeon]
MNEFGTPADIDVAGAIEKVKKGSRLIWVLGNLDARRHARLQEVSEDVYLMDPEEIMESKDPEKLVGRSPVLVCEHGVTSMFLAKELRKRHIEAFSIDGGVEGMFKWHS